MDSCESGNLYGTAAGRALKFAEVVGGLVEVSFSFETGGIAVAKVESEELSGAPVIEGDVEGVNSVQLKKLAAGDVGAIEARRGCGDIGGEGIEGMGVKKKVLFSAFEKSEVGLLDCNWDSEELFGSSGSCGKPDGGRDILGIVTNK